MIASTKRGIWAHRFNSAGVVNPRTLLLTGVTRDGTFLIENGKITKPVKNLPVQRIAVLLLEQDRCVRRRRPRVR
jgi:predicted Zn-dependent protease